MALLSIPPGESHTRGPALGVGPPELHTFLWIPYPYTGPVSALVLPLLAQASYGPSQAHWRRA